MKTLGCFIGLHTWIVMSKEVGVYNKNNSYASMRQMRVCALRLCLDCNRIKVSPIRNQEPTANWVKPIGYINKKQEILTSQTKHMTSNVIIEKNTPIVRGFHEKY